MIAYAFDNSSDEVALACFEVHVEECRSGVRIFEWAAVSVEPRGEDNAVRACRNLLDDILKIGVKRGVNAFRIFGYMMLLKINADLVESEVILDPLDALSCRFKLGEIVRTCRGSADDSGDHG